MTHAVRNDEELYSELVRLLGDGAVSAVESGVAENRDGAPVWYIQVTYPSGRAPSVKDMSRVLDALWPTELNDAAPVPVVSFLDASETGCVAA